MDANGRSHFLHATGYRSDDLNLIDIDVWRLAAIYLLLIFPLGLILWLKIPILGKTVIAIVRMTVQLLLVGFYLQFIFHKNNIWITAGWLIIMILVADVSIARSTGLRLRKLGPGLFLSLLPGTAIPLLYFTYLVVGPDAAMEPQYVIPIAGMILGNCLRADIIGVGEFYESLRERKKLYLLRLSQGATHQEALRPFLRDALESSLAPTVATIATTGLVSLPGMMTGVILGGGNPMAAIKYQIAIMIAILSGTAITVILAIRITIPWFFDARGVLDPGIFREPR